MARNILKNYIFRFFYNTPPRPGLKNVSRLYMNKKLTIQCVLFLDKSIYINLFINNYYDIIIIIIPIKYTLINHNRICTSTNMQNKFKNMSLYSIVHCSFIHYISYKICDVKIFAHHLAILQKYSIS